MIERVGADNGASDVVLEDNQGGKPAGHRRGLADADHAVVGMHAQEGAALLGGVPLGPFDLEGFDTGDFHGVWFPWFAMPFSAICNMNSL